MLEFEPNTAASFRVLIGPFTLPGTVITWGRLVRGVWIFACPGQIIPSIRRPMSFIKPATVVPIWGGGVRRSYFTCIFRHRRDYIFRDSNYFGLYTLFALLLNLMTNQFYAQVTIVCNTVESPILHNTLLYANKTVRIAGQSPECSDCPLNGLE